MADDTGSKPVRTTLALATALLLPLVISAKPKPGEAASIQGIQIQGDAKPGSKVTVLITVQLEKGYHVHSHKPSQPEFIPTVLTLSPATGSKAGSVTYPKGKTEKVENLAKPLSIYTEQFELSLTVTLDPTSVLPVTIPASLSYQACQGTVCYPPKKLKFEISIAAAP